jgi:hypothetical protein
LCGWLWKIKFTWFDGALWYHENENLIYGCENFSHCVGYLIYNHGKLFKNIFVFGIMGDEANMPQLKRPEDKCSKKNCL